MPLTEIEAAKKSLREKIEASVDVAEITKLRTDASLLNSPEAESARTSAMRLVKVEHLKLESSLGALVDAVNVELDKQVSLVLRAEVDLYDGFGFPHESTPLMGKLQAVQSRLAHHKQTLAQSKLPEFARQSLGDGNHVLDTFGA